MKWKAYIANYFPEEEKVKIGIRIYDSDLPTQWKELDENQVEIIKIRDEYPITIYVPYNQSEEYIKDRVKEAIEKHKIRMIDIEKLNSLKDRNEQIE